MAISMLLILINSGLRKFYIKYVLLLKTYFWSMNPLVYYELMLAIGI